MALRYAAAGKAARKLSGLTRREFLRENVLSVASAMYNLRSSR
jgi:hypothetical protein